VLFGGRAAEEVVFGDVTTGAHDDIRKATDLARRMVTEYGMSTRLGAVDYATERPNAFGYPGPTDATRSPETSEAIEQEVRSILDFCHERAQRVLHDNRPVLEAMAAALLEAEVLDGERIHAFLGQVQKAERLAEAPSTAVERRGV
jgi:cell division protease FtsH